MERVRSLLNELPISADTDYMRNLAVETEESLATVAKLTKRAISNPHDEDNQRRLLSAFIEHKAKIALIQSEMSQNAPEIKKLTEYMKTSEMERASFVSSLKAKNVAAARTSYNQYISANKAYLDAYKRIPDKRQIILDSNSPDATEATHSKFSEAEELQQSIATQAMRIFQNPTDEEAQTTLLDLIAASRERISSIQLSVSKTPRQLKYLSTLVDAQQVKILDGVQIDVDAYDSAITQYLDSAVKFTTIAKGLIEKAKYSKDGDRLKPLLIEFEDSLNCIKEKSQQAIRNPSNRDLQNELTIMLDENKQLMSTLQNELNAKLEPYENHVRAIEEFSMHLLQSVKSGDTAYIIDALNANETEQDTLTHITEGNEKEIRSILKKNSPVLSFLGILSKIEDNGQSVKIRKALADISERTGSIQQLIQELSQEPENQKKQKQFSKLVDAQIKQWSQLQSTIRRALVGEIATTAASLSDHNRVESILGYQFDVANKGKLGDAELANSDFHHAFNRISDLTNIAISMVSSMTPQVASDLELQKARLEKLGPSVITAAQGLAANPKDEGVKEFARGILTAWEDSMKEIVNLTIGQEGLFKATEILSGTQSMLDTQFSSFQKSYQMEDALACQKNAMALVASTTQFLMTARREIENTTDSVFRGSLEIKVAAIEKST